MKTCLVCGTELQPPAGRGRPTETCSPEHAAIRRRQLRETSRQKAIKRGIPADSNVHGTSTGYTYYKCPCIRCLKWAREYKASQRELAKAADPRE